MPKVFNYEVQRSADNDAHGATLKFSLLDSIPPGVLEEALKLRSAIESTNRDIVIVLDRVQAMEAYGSYLSRLEETMVAGFGSELQDFSMAWFLLSQLREDFIKLYGQRVRSAYIRLLTQIVACIGVPALLYGSAVSPWSTWWWPSLQGNIEAQVRTAAWVICGVCVSVWLSFVIRTRQLEWSMLTSLDPDGLSPVTRIGLVLAVTYVFALLLKLGGITIAIGSLNLSNFILQPSIAILVGLIGGLGGDALADIVVGRVRGLANSPNSGEAGVAARAGTVALPRR